MCLIFLGATKQLEEHFYPSVCLSVCLSHVFHCVPIIVSSWNFHRVITNDIIDPRAKGHVQRSKVKVTGVKTQFNCFQTVTLVWIHIWRHDAQSLVLRGALLFSRSSVKFHDHMAKKFIDFDPNWSFSDCNSSSNSPVPTEWSQSLK